MLSSLSKIWLKYKQTIITSQKLHQISTNQSITYQNYIWTKHICQVLRPFFFLFLRELGSKTLGLNVFELQSVLCWQTMIKTQSLGLGLLKICLFVKLELSDCKIYWTKSARLDRSKIRLDQSNHVQIYFSAEFQFNPNST